MTAPDRTTARAGETVSLNEVERALRPLRRVLARGAGLRVGDPWAAAATARLAAPLGALVLPPPLDDDLRELHDTVAGLVDEAPDAAAARLERAWQLVCRIDGVLGLPLSDVAPPAAKGRLLQVREPAPARPAPGAAAPSTPAAPDAEAAPEAPAEPVGLLAGAAWDTALGDLDLPDTLLEGAAAAGLETLWDLLSLRPTESEALATVHGAGRELPEGRVAVGGRVRARVSVLRPGGERIDRLLLHGAGPLACAWGRPFSDADMLRTPPGAKVVVVGTTAPEGLVAAELAAGWHGRAVRTRYGDLPATVGELVHLALESVERVAEPASTVGAERIGLPRLADAVFRAHTRLGDEAARRRLAHEEALHLALGLSHPRFDGADEPGVAHLVVHQRVAELQSRDGLDPLDDALQAALEDIKRDLRATRPMARVICGDAASGVDEVALHAMLTVLEGRSQVLVVAPDAPSAAVLYGRWEGVLRASGLTPLLVAGDPRRADREALRRGELHVAFGPPSSFDLGLEWRRLGLVVAFEQAHYGDAPRRVRALRPPRPDLLVVARSPLPVDVLLGAYPTLDVAQLPSRPEAPAAGTVWAEGDRELAWRALGEARAAGSPLLVAFPMRRGGTDLLTLREVDALVSTLRSQVLEGAEVAVFHGALQVNERVRAWEDFLERRAAVLVATTTVELMGPLPRGVVALVEHADRMDPQRLVGLRAQVTAAGHLHYVCGADPDPQGVERVKALAASAADGVLAARGEVFDVVEGAGTPVRPAWTWLEPARDADLVLAARAEAHALLRADATLRAHPQLLRTAAGGWRRLRADVACPLPAPREPAPGPRRRRRRRRR